ARLTELWTSKRDQMQANADVLAKETRRVMKPSISPKTVAIDDELIESVFGALVSSFDSEYGGIDFHLNQPNGPKFPTPVKLAFIQEQLQRS
ncbi:hypothetical protein ABTM94_19250, partial [Acinetobacter baumannii]